MKSSATKTPLIQAVDVKKHFIVGSSLFRGQRRTVYAVDGVSLEVYPGETLGLVGESGCGKSTLGRCLMRLYEITAGQILLNGRDISQLGPTGAAADPRRDADGLSGPLCLAQSAPARGRSDRRTAARSWHAQPRRDRSRGSSELMELVGLQQDHLNRFPHEFSGGQRQRIGVARALALEPSLIIADEPVSALDVSIQAQIVNLFADLQERLGLTYIFIAHDLSVVRQVSSRVAVMYLGAIVETGPTEEIFRNPAHPYTEALVSAVPVPEVDRGGPQGAHRADRRRAQPDEPAGGLPLPSALPLCHPALQGRAAGPGAGRQGPAGRLPLPAAGRNGCAARKSAPGGLEYLRSAGWPDFSPRQPAPCATTSAVTQSSEKTPAIKAAEPPAVQALLRPAATVMRAKRLGSFHPTRLSFSRSLLRRLARENWRFTRTQFELNARGYGHLVYEIETPKGLISFAGFSNYLAPEDRTDRVIAEKWDAAFALTAGRLSEEALARLAGSAPRQEAARFSADELVLSRANKSLRLFDSVAQALAAGRQPALADVVRVGYLMRTTAVYGNGKFGLADLGRLWREGIFSLPYEAEMLMVYMIRQFSFDLIEHIARRMNPAAVSLSATTRRALGIGNATGLGMAPFLVGHPALFNNWILARETALGPRSRNCSCHAAKAGSLSHPGGSRHRPCERMGNG